MNADILLKYFPQITEEQRARFEQLDALYREWNEKINVISRRDIDNLYTHHVLHSLGIAKVVDFPNGASILDIGTGGGFPGIPLAILFPECRFKLIDSIGKKVKVAAAVAGATGLKNVQVQHLNAKEERGKYDYVVSRAVMQAPDLVQLIRKNVVRSDVKLPLPHGLLCLKGGDLAEELAPFEGKTKVWNLKDCFTEEDYFETKKVVYIKI